ncbi:hypothetical protein BDP27DRAFT_465077 [Rhodocollybia butyracea]|uniref:Uncharacterized protein n=1 Tax=Rhodocollybia butyracea TaxID=206335 RepID=A0A9P5P642_9AGAR|nr:hypothetical protein BDP27DRAFT_465077 [Rhodocollybia butyracea]
MHFNAVKAIVSLACLLTAVQGLAIERNVKEIVERRDDAHLPAHPIRPIHPIAPVHPGHGGKREDMRGNIIVGTMKERFKAMVKAITATVGGRETKATMVNIAMEREMKATLVDTAMAKAATVGKAKETEAKAAMVDPEVISAIVT